MRAFHGKSSVKKKYLTRLSKHRLADEIIQGKYWENGKGCAVGCTIHGSNHRSYETELGIPQIIAHLEDRIFEGLPLHLAKTWPERFLKAIKLGADLRGVWDGFASRLLTDPIGGVIQYARTAEQLEAIQRVSDLYEARIAGLEVPLQQFMEASKASYAAAGVADYAAYACYFDADAAYYAAYVDAAAKEQAYIFQSKLLLELLKGMK